MKKLLITAISDYTGAFAGSRACSVLRAAGYEVKSHQLPARSEKSLVKLLEHSDAVVLTHQRTQLPKEVLKQSPRLKWILNTGRNFSHLPDEAFLKEQGIKLVGGAGHSPHSKAEMAWALILASQRNVVREANAVQTGAWQSLGPGISLHGKVLGVYGLGGTGRVVASIGAAFGMRVIVHEPVSLRMNGGIGRVEASVGRESTAKEAETNGYRYVSKEELFEEADVLTLHLKSNAQALNTSLPYSDQQNNLAGILASSLPYPYQQTTLVYAENAENMAIVTASDLASMKPTALFVNTARAELVAPGALVSALTAENPRPGRAALDVFEEEPLPANHPLVGLPNCYVTDSSLVNCYENIVREFLQEQRQ